MYFEVLISVYMTIVSSQYLVDKYSHHKYLKYEFENTNNHIFPKNLSFSYHITRIAGLLFYSIDKNLNQFIVTLEDENPVMNIHFRGQKHSTNLADICDCKYDDCLYQKLNFQFQINKEIEISCNSDRIKKYPYATTKYKYDDYPFPNFGENNKSAYLWFINVPSDQQKNTPFSNGCISDIFYNGESLDTTTPGSFKKCINLCKPDSCNGGNCVEKYDKKIMCDCETTFNNGEYCNEPKCFNGTISDEFKIKKLKVSWNCNVSGILLQMHKDDGSIVISADTDIGIYTLKLVYNKNGIIYSAETKIQKSEKYVLLMIFENACIKYRIINGISNSNFGSVTFAGNKNLAKWIFKNITFNNQCSSGSVVLKASNHIKWINIYDTDAFNKKHFIQLRLRHKVRSQTTKKSTDKIPRYTTTKKSTDKIPRYTDSQSLLNILLILFGIIDFLLICFAIRFLNQRYAKETSNAFQ